MGFEHGTEQAGAGVAFKFVHTADLHLDSPLKSLALREEGLADLVGNATRTALSRIVDLCLSETVQALLIAGDLYDGAQTSMKTARYLAQQMQRLDDADIPVFVIRGNHDALSRITRELVLPDCVTTFAARAGVVETTWNGHPVAVHGISFAKPHAPDSLLPRYKRPVDGAFNIGLMHSSLGGAAGHDPYAPCTLSDLQDSGFDYWALGHIHQRAVYEGAATVVMPGNPQGRDIGEDGKKSVTLVQVNDDGTVLTRACPVAIARFERLPLDCSGIADWPELVGHLKQTLVSARRDHDSEHLIVRPVLGGTSALAWRARRDIDLLRAEAQRIAEDIGSLWIDKLEVALAEESALPPAGALGDLGAMIAKSPPAPTEPRVQAELDLLLKHLPRDLRGLWGDSQEDQARALARDIELGARDVLARLNTGDD